MKLERITKSNGKSLYGQFLTMTLLPLIVSGIVMILGCSFALRTNIQNEASKDLSDVALTVLKSYDWMYEGDYEAALDGDKLYLLKGGEIISEDQHFIDDIKAGSNIEVSIFMMDTRILTTLRNADGERLTGTVASNRIITDVYDAKQAKFFNNVSIEGHMYFAYYEPIYSTKGEIVGMIGTAKPAEDVNISITHSIRENLIIMCLAIGITALFIILFANNMIKVIKFMMDFMKQLSSNNLDAKLSEVVTHREDELGLMGRMMVDLKISLRRLIERDVLTGLYNRRHAEKKIDQIEDSGVSYCVSIGDIDYFKKFNDTFGHECGDVVLKEVARTLNDNMAGKGFVARWGGEEFLLVYENADIESAYAALMGIREVLHDKDIEYDNNTHKVTMTFGVAEKTEGIKINELIKLADDKLYEGKQGGRDRVIR